MIVNVMPRDFQDLCEWLTKVCPDQKAPGQSVTNRPREQIFRFDLAGLCPQLLLRLLSRLPLNQAIQ